MGDYREDARAALARADEELATGDHRRLRYVALELRMAVEALTYYRASAYKDEFPPAEYDTWQPKRVMRVLLDLDLNADANSSVCVAAEPEDGRPPAAMRALGTERVFGMAAIKESYDALGSYLHVPTLRQRHKGALADHDRMRARCLAIAEAVRQSLSSTVRHVTFGAFWRFSCGECGQLIRKRRSEAQTGVTATCFNCASGYTLTDLGEEQWSAVPKGATFACANADCGRGVFVPTHQSQVGREWTCLDCGGTNEFGLTVIHRPASELGMKAGSDEKGWRG